MTLYFNMQKLNFPIEFFLIANIKDKKIAGILNLDQKRNTFIGSFFTFLALSKILVVLIEFMEKISIEVIFILLILFILHLFNVRILLQSAYYLINNHDVIALLPFESFLLYLRLLQPLLMLFKKSLLYVIKKKKKFFS